MAELVPQFIITTDVLDLTAKDIGLVSDPGSYTRAWVLTSEGVEITTGAGAEFVNTLATDKVYDLKLTITEAGNTGTTLMRVSTSGGVILPYQTINSVVSSLLPGYTIDWSQVQHLKTKWQSVLCAPLEIPEGNCYNELAYPQAANSLIGYLIVRDILVSKANTYLAQVSAGSGSIKKIVTGPTEVERYNPSDAYAALFGNEAAWEGFLSQMCSLALSLDINFKDCGSDHILSMKVAYLSDYTYQHKYITAPPEFKQKP